MRKTTWQRDELPSRNRFVSVVFPPCPFLPLPKEAMDWKHFSIHGDARGAEFYFTALEYGNYLWQRGMAARALLCLDRAMGADLASDEPILAQWPMPYGAMAWLLKSTPPVTFIGNPRVHFQHYAGRMNEPRRDQRRWRAWGCWEIARVLLPELPGDPRHAVDEPNRDEISVRLEEFGLAGEAHLWRESVAYAEKLVDVGI